jgi:hypothetical protein
VSAEKRKRLNSHYGQNVQEYTAVYTKTHIVAHKRLKPLVVAQVPVLESEVTLLPYAPTSLPVKVEVLPLLILVCHLVRLGMSLEPCQELDMESPRLFLQFLRCQPLLICPWHIVENPEECLYVQALEELW